MLTSRDVRWGVLGTGFITDHFIRGAAKSTEGRVTAVASRDIDRATDLATRYGLETAYGQYDDLLGDPSIDVVYIALPNALHVDWSIRALAAGKHVLCEKPLSSNRGDVDRAFDAAEVAGRYLSEGFMWRHHPATQRAVALVDAQEIGAVREVRSAFSFVVSDPKDIRLSASLEGGSLMDLGCYCVNAARLFGGEPDSVLGIGTGPVGGVDVRFEGRMTLRSGASARFRSALDAPAESNLDVVGADATLRLIDPWHGRASAIEMIRGVTSTRIEVERADSYQLEFDDLSLAIAGRRSPLLGRSDAVGQARVIGALHRSAMSRVEVDVADR